MSWQPVSPMLSRTSASESRVRITQGHQISISLAAWKLLGEPSYVSLLVDPDRSLLALKASDGNEPEVFRLTPNSKGGTSKRFSTVALNRVFGVGTQPQSYTPQLRGGLARVSLCQFGAGPGCAGREGARHVGRRGVEWSVSTIAQQVLAALGNKRDGWRGTAAWVALRRAVVPF